MVDIKTNLLKNQQTLSEKDYQKERQFLQWSVFGVVVVVVGVVALSIWNLLLTRQMSTIELAITKASKEMQGLSQASVSQVYLKSRLNLVTGFLADRSIIRDSLQKVFSISIPGVHVAGLAFSEANVVSVQFVASTISPLNAMLAYFQADTGDFTQVASSGLTRAKDGTYQMALALTLPKEEKK
ncbi:MAG: hypothetical protein ABII21_03605 [bacterium]